MAFGISDTALKALRRNQNEYIGGGRCEYCGRPHAGIVDECRGCGAPLMTLEAMEEQEDGYCYEYLTGDNTIISTYRYPCP